MPSPELFLDPDPRDEDYDDSASGPLDEDEDEDEDPGPVTYEDEDPDPGIEAEDDGDEMSEASDDEDEDARSEADDAGAEDLEDGPPVPPEGNREVRWVPLGELQIERKFWKNPRLFTGLDDMDIQSLAADIQAKTVSDISDENMFAGITEPLLVVRVKAGNQVEQLVLDGQRRYLAAQVAFPKKNDSILIPVVDREPEPVEWTQELAQRYLREVLTAVTLRQGLSAFELSESAARLRASNDEVTGNVTTMAKIAQIIGRSESWVSKILGARAVASPKLLDRWRKGEISEEQFRDLATGTKGSEQDKEADKVAEARASGDKSGARQSAKEKKEIARREAQAKRDKAKADKEAAKAKKKADKEAAKKMAKGKGKKGPVVGGPQADLPLAAEPEKSEKSPPVPPKTKPMQGVIIDDIVAMSEKKPPTHDLVKGVILGILVAAGRLDMAQLPKQWHQYVNHAAGIAPAKPAKKRKSK